MRKVLIVISILICGIIYTQSLPIHAQSTDPNIYSSCDKLKDIQAIIDCRNKIACDQNKAKGILTCDGDSLFKQPEYLDPKNFSLVSWITLFINIGIVLLIAYYVLLIVKSAFTIISSFGSSEKVAEGVKQIQAVFRSIAALFIFLVIIILAAKFLGVGFIWEWPAAFSQCKKLDNNFYFSEKLKNPNLTVSGCN